MHCDSDKFATSKFGFRQAGRQAGRPPDKISKEFNNFRLTLKIPFVVMSWSAQLVQPLLIRLEDQIRLILMIQLEEYHCCRWPSKVLVDICEDCFCCLSKMWGWVCLEYQIDPFGNSVREDCFQLDSQRSVLLHTLRGTRGCRKNQEISSYYKTRLVTDYGCIDTSMLCAKNLFRLENVGILIDGVENR